MESTDQNKTEEYPAEGSKFYDDGFGERIQGEEVAGQDEPMSEDAMSTSSSEPDGRGFHERLDENGQAIIPEPAEGSEADASLDLKDKDQDID